jgi:hypothetical protein
MLQKMILGTFSVFTFPKLAFADIGSVVPPGSTFGLVAVPFIMSLVNIGLSLLFSRIAFRSEI